MILLFYSIFAVYDFNSPYGESCYRLMTRTGDFIYLRTRGFLDIDRESNQVRSFVCVNALVDEDEGKKLVREMKKKFTIMIHETEISSNEPDVPAVENPVQLERAIISLITNLPSDSGAASPETQSSVDGHESDTNRSVKSPPLEIIAPKASSIKTSIIGSLDVMKPSSVHAKNASSDSEDDKSTVKKTTKVVRTSVVQRNGKLNSDDETITSNRTKLNGSSSTTTSPMKSSQNCCTATSTTTTTQLPSSSSTVLISTETTSSSHSDAVRIKQEQPDALDDSRVPPLPTNASYFDMSPYNSQQYMDDISSPNECKPFDFLGFDPLQVQQADQNRFLTPETAAQYQQFDTGDTSNQSKANINHTSNQTINVSGIKRSRSSENLATSNKRRFYDASNGGQHDDGTGGGGGGGGGNGSDGSEHDEKVPLSIQTCIQNFTDPGLGIYSGPTVQNRSLSTFKLFKQNKY